MTPDSVAPARISGAEVRALRRKVPGAFARPAGERLRVWGAWALFLAVLILAMLRMNIGLPQLWLGLGKLGWMAKMMLPPSSGGAFWDFAEGILETLAMAFLGTLGSSLVSIPLGFLGARNVVHNRLAHFALRRLFDILRGVDSLIWALIFVSAVGLGPFAGILAIFVSETGSLAKLFAEAVENVPTPPVEGVRAAGGNGVQVVRFGMFPAVLPVLLSNSLYYFESNTRSATILGIVGAGGIGLYLADRIRVNNWSQVALIVLMILVTVYAIDAFSRVMRLRLIGRKTYQA